MATKRRGGASHLRAYEYSDRTWRGIISATEWSKYRLSVFKSNLAIAAVLRELRLVAELSGIAVSREIGVSSSTLCSWETGRTLMNEKRQSDYERAIEKLAKKLEAETKRRAA